MCETPVHQEDIISMRLAPVLAAAAERIHYAEARRANYSVMAGALIAAGIAIFTFAFGATDVQWMRFGAAAGSLSMIAVGAVVLYFFGKQTNRYPFTEATKTWKWFYRDALPNHKAFDLKLWQRWSAQEKRVQKAYTDQLPEFKKRILKLADNETNLDQDIQQAYVLHINEKYKNLYLSRLRSLFNLGLIVIAVLTIVGGLIGVWCEAASHKIVSSSFSNNSWAYQTEYRLISSPISETAEWVVRITATSKLDRPMSIQRLLVRDREGWPLPVDIKYVTPLPQLVMPHQSTILFAVIESNSAVMKKIFSMEMEIL